MSTSSTCDFPLEDLVPKNETNAASFVAQNPLYNGKNVRVGILDTGVDPGAFGLNKMEDGQTPKLVDVIDCTGSGDVDVSTERTATLHEDTGFWHVEGLSGKTLKFNSALPPCPFPGKPETKEAKQETTEGPATSTTSKPMEEQEESKKEETTKTITVRLGLKRAYELFPSKLTKRVKDHRLISLNQSLAGYTVKVRQELADFNAKTTSNSKLTPAQIKTKEDLEARLALLQDKEWQEDPGPLYDIVVFYDGQHYRALVDTSENGDLTNQPALTDFNVELEYASFGTLEQYNYAVHFYDEGKILNIVCDAGAHGSHVAGITAAAEEDRRCGVAPGAELVSLKIGDTRLGSMETGTALTRALIQAVRTKCDVINPSYGEGCVLPNTGRFVKLAEELVYKHNILFVSSAGNNGPALSTVGAPGGTSSAILGVAAHVSSRMMVANYSMMEKKEASATATEEGPQLVPTTYTWSSVGPTADGDNGVNVMAPGGAITSVPHWTMQKSQLMNGTSMSSPHATGCVALLLSACKHEGVPISASRIYRAIENTARPMEGLSTLQQGWGMIQVDKAWEYLVANKDNKSEDVHFEVCVENRSGSPRGVYLREPDEASVRQTFSINVDPKFRYKDDVEDETQKNRIQFEMHFRLEATEAWVMAPEFFMLMHNGRSFKIEVDPTGLPPGVHTAKVLAYDSARPEGKIMFSLPVTAVKTLKEQPQIKLGELEFKPTEVKRFFVTVPSGATWMDVTIRDCREDDDASPRLVVLHAVQLLPHAAYRDAEVQKYFHLVPSQTAVSSIRVHDGTTCELDLARYWSTTGTTKIDVRIEFRGVLPVPNTVQLVSGNGGACVRMFSNLKNETISPSAKLTKWKTPLRPKADGVISPLGDRDVFPSTDKRIYQLVLTYEHKLEEACSFTARAPALQGVLYESSYESQMMLIFDIDKKFLGVADSWPSEIKAEKGTIAIRMQIRHDEPEMLEKLKDMVIWIERKMKDATSLSAYPSKEAMMTEKNSAFKKRALRKGTSASVFFAEPPISKIPSACKPGDILFGTAQFVSSEASLPGSVTRPGGFKVSYLVGPKSSSKGSESSTPEVPDVRTAEEKMAEAVRDLKVEQLSKITAKEKEAGKFEQLYEALEKEYPDHLPLLCSWLKHVDEEKKREEASPKVIAAADKMIGKIVEDELALHFGTNHDKDDPVSCKERKEMEKKKDLLIEALARKARAFADLKSDDAGANFDKALASLKKWVDIDSDKKYAVLVIEREKRAGRSGSAVKFLNTLLKNKGEETKGGICPLSQSDLLEKRAQFFGDLGYNALVEHDKKWRLINAPKSFALF